MAVSTERRLALFSPMPPARTGVAAVSADLIPALRREFQVDVFDDAASRRDAAGGARSAHDFVWLHQQHPYDLTVYQLGNSSHHDFIWPYAFRYPGLIVFHDACLHHARAAVLLRAGRRDHYRAEFAANEPETARDAAELAVAGFDSPLLYRWPMRRLLMQRSRATAVHAPRLARTLAEEVADADVHLIRLAHGVLVDDEQRTRRGFVARRRLGIASDAVLFGVFGGLSPEKRVPQVLRAFATLRLDDARTRLLLAGQAAAHYDLAADLKRFGLEDAAIVTGYLESDEALTDAMCACDAALSLRWPSAGEISGPWLRLLAAGVPTVITQLPHLVSIPWLDPRTWSATRGGLYQNAEQDAGPEVEAICVGVDILDEDHSLLLAMRRLARDAALRATLGRAGRVHWRAHHALALMLDDYRRAIDAAIARPVPAALLPSHLTVTGDGTLTGTLALFGLADPWT